MKSIELFAGIGGIALAAEWAGIETVAFCERDEFCQKVLKKHWPNVPIFDDIETLNRKVLEEAGVIEPGGTVDVISGGFPCQPYSVAGKQRGAEDDRDLWPEMFRVISELRPTWVVGENVANFVNLELERTLSDLEGEGYETQTFIIPACGVDAKHRRDRTFVVAYSDSIGRLEHEGQQEEIQQSRKQKLQREKSEQPILSKPLYSSYQALADTNFSGCKERNITAKSNSKRFYPGAFTKGWAEWEPEPNVGRVAHGVPNRLDRLRALGNAVVPQQIYPIFKAIVNVA